MASSLASCPATDPSDDVRKLVVTGPTWHYASWGCQGLPGITRAGGNWTYLALRVLQN